MKKIIYILIFAYCGILCVHASSVEGCTFIAYGLHHCELKFVSSDVCVMSQLNRVSRERRIDTLGYAWHGYVDLYVFPICPSLETSENKQLPPRYYLSFEPYIYKDGASIRCYPIGGSSIVRRAYSFMAAPSKELFKIKDTIQMQLVSPSILLGFRRNDYMYLLATGKPKFEEPPSRGYKRKLRAWIFHLYAWEYHLYSRKTYEGSAPHTLSGKMYNYASSPISESLQFLNDSSCVYSLRNDDIMDSVEYDCTYSLLPDGIVIVRTDSSASHHSDLQNLIRLSQKDSSKIKNISPIAAIGCDTFLLHDDVLYYSKMYPQTAFLSVPDSLPRVHPMTHLIQTKAFVLSGRKRSSLKIGRFYQKYYIPINFMPTDE